MRILTAAVLASALLACAPAPEQVAEEPRSQAAIQAEEATARLEAAGEGAAIVLRAIEAHGGLEAWYAAPTSSYIWEYSNVTIPLRFSTRMTVDNQTRRAYHEILTLGTPDDAPAYQGRFAWDGTDAWISPADTPKVNPRFWALTGYYFEQIPFVLADPGLTYEKLPDAELDGVAHDMVRVGFESGVGDAPGDTYVLYVNKETDRLAAIRYTVTYYSQRGPQEKAGPRPETLFYYEDFQTVDGLSVPGKFRGFQFADGKKGDQKSEAWCREISFSQPFDESQLEMPEGAKVQPAP